MRNPKEVQSLPEKAGLALPKSQMHSDVFLCLDKEKVECIRMSKW